MIVRNNETINVNSYCKQGTEVSKSKAQVETFNTQQGKAKQMS